ncbi:MAG: hypothetical protein ABWY00_08560 [Dongiaceae bacterium]
MQTWDISFLVDSSGKISEARGDCQRLFGEGVRQFIGRGLLPYISNSDRAHFRRFLIQLTSPSAVRQAIVHLRTQLLGDQPFVMEAQSGWGAGHYWVMFATAEAQSGYDAVSALQAPIPKAHADELLLMIELVAMQQTQSLDLTVVEVGGLMPKEAQSAPAGGAQVEDLDAEMTQKLQQSVEQSLTANALDGVVSKSAQGIYNVLHPSELGVAKIAGDLRQGARILGVNDDQLGLKQRSVTLGVNPDRDRIRAAVEEATMLGAGAGQPVVAPVQRAVPVLWMFVAAVLVVAVAAGMMLMR